MKRVIAVCLVFGIAGCEQQQYAAMGTALQEMVQAQTDTHVRVDSVGGSMAGIGDHVGTAYRGDVDHPEDVKDAMDLDFVRRK